MRIVNRILLNCILKKARPYLDDVRVKGLRTYYNYKEAIPRIWRFMLEHIQNLDKVLERIKRASATIRAKSKFCIPVLQIVGFITNANRRYLDTAKIIKIIK